MGGKKIKSREKRQIQRQMDALLPTLDVKGAAERVARRLGRDPRTVLRRYTTANARIHFLGELKLGPGSVSIRHSLDSLPFLCEAMPVESRPGLAYGPVVPGRSRNRVWVAGSLGMKVVVYAVERIV